MYQSAAETARDPAGMTAWCTVQEGLTQLCIIILFLQAELGVAQRQVQGREIVGASPQVQSCTFTKSLSQYYYDHNFFY